MPSHPLTRALRLAAGVLALALAAGAHAETEPDAAPAPPAKQPPAQEPPATEPPEEETLSETAARYFCAYEPNYFVLGAVEKGRSRPTTKFQFSFQVMLFDLSRPDDPTLDSCANPAGRHLIHMGYTQKSIWDLYEASAPFDENNYNPEVFYGYHLQRFGISWLTLGVDHESNGEGGDGSRSWNRVYAQARWDFRVGRRRFQTLPTWPGDRDHWYGWVEMKVWYPFLTDDDNVDPVDYFGYAGLRGAISSREYDWGSFGFDFEAIKGGNPIEFERAGVQLGLSYRQPRFGRVKFVPFFYLQYFEGYGETLSRADDHTRALRAGLRFVL